MRRIAVTTLLCLSPLAAIAQEDWSNAPQNVDATPEFVFEGDVDYVDPVLRDDIGPPRVLSGTMRQALKPSHSEIQDRYGVEIEKGKAYRAGYRGLITAAEFTLDRNYVLSAQAVLDPDRGDAIYYRNGEERDEEDEVRFDLFMTGPSLESGFIPQKMIIILDDDDGKMIDSVEPLAMAPKFSAASFQLIFTNPETGETAKATGEITLFANLERESSPELDFAQLEEQIRELDQKLADKEKLVSNLRAQLNLKDVDLAERDQRIADLEAENAKLAEESEQLRNGEALQVMEKTNAKLLEKLEESQQAREFSASSVAQMTVRQEFLAKDNADLAKTNAKLREELADALADLGEMRNQQEMLARQFNKSFQSTLPPLPEPSRPKSPAGGKKLGVEVIEEPPAEPATAPSADGSMREMAIAALQGQPGVEITDGADEQSPPGEVPNDTRPSAVVSPEQARGKWQFPLPIIATVSNPQQTPNHRSVAEPEAEEASDHSNRIPRRGPRR